MIVVVLIVVLFLAANMRLFLWSPIDAPAHVDAVVALGGDPGQRRAHYAIALAEQGFAPVAVISLGGNPPVACPTATAVQVVCFRADPLDTRGEAQYVAALVARHHWAQIMVVPERSQTTRARVLFNRCTDVDIRWTPVSDPLPHLPYDVAYEWGALFKALVLQRSC